MVINLKKCLYREKYRGVCARIYRERVREVDKMKG